jgi:hypothetical protein
VNGQANADMQKASVTITQKLYVSKTYFFEIRAFTGIMGLNQNHSELISYSFKMGGYNGTADYLYDNLYFGRSETNGVAAAQFAETNGAFKASTGYIGQSNNWLVSCNIKSPKLFKLPLLFYADIGTCAADGFPYSNLPGSYNPPNLYTHIQPQGLFYDAGIDIVIARDIFEIFVPLAISSNIQNNSGLNGVNNNLFHQIRFVLNLNKVNPFTLIKQAISF